MVREETDIWMIMEKKLDDFFPASQYLIQGFCIPFRLNRNKNSDAILLYIRNNITSTKLKKYIIKNQIEAFFVEIRLEIVYHFFVVHMIQINCKLHPTLKKYLMELMLIAISLKNILIMGDFNVDVKEVILHLFCNQYKITEQRSHLLQEY